MNNIDQQYLSLLQDILYNGVEKNDRTGVGTRSVFGRQIRHKMSDGFPLLTTKKMSWKSIVVELLWFLRGDTNIKFLVDNGISIWNGDAYKAYVNKWHQNFKLEGVRPDENQRPLSLEEYVEFARNNSLETLESVGGFDLGPIYGKQWRQWQGYTKEGYSMWYDQIQRVLHSLKTDPDSRRMMASAWNVGELDEMVLPPCHYGFQVYTRKLNFHERSLLAIKQGWRQEYHIDDYSHEDFNKLNIPTRAISLMWNQRSVDTPLGLPFNIASYGLLLMLIAKEVNMVPDELIGNLGDCHIYNNQIDGIKEQLTREPYPLPQVHLDFDYSYSDGYIVEWDKIAIEQIKLVNYQSHPAIKIPLSN
jgi:thymidylate synthase